MADTVASARASMGTDDRYETRRVKETRRAFQTTEFFVLIVAAAAVIVVGYADNDTLNAARIWTLVTVLASAYMVSRGLAKAGSRDSITDVRD